MTVRLQLGESHGWYGHDFGYLILASRRSMHLETARHVLLPGPAMLFAGLRQSAPCSMRVHRSPFLQTEHHPCCSAFTGMFSNWAR
jgi:hypothetical protein